VSYTSDKGLITRIYRELKKLKSLKINEPIKKWATELNRTFSKEEIQMAKKYMKKMFTMQPMWVAIHKYMEATLGISLYRNLYPKLAKMLCLSYYLLCFLFNKIGEEGRTGYAWKWGRGVAQTMYTHVSKCKNNKIKGGKKRTQRDDILKVLKEKGKKKNLIIS
jgi:hypothetical protein